MSITLVRKSQIRPLNITRSDINTTTSGSALITKIIAGTGLTLSSSTGVNPGTGDVTVALSIATASTLGGVKIGSGLSVAVDGTISVNSVTTTWGSITGLLSNQTDLQAALNAKYNNPTGTSSQYIDGTGAYQTFPSALATGFVRHEVKAGVAINKGQAVYVTGADGTNMIVGLASNASEATSSKTMGLMESTVAINGKGNVVTEGLLAGLNTVGANAGDPVWLGTGGNLIYGLINKPYAPKHLVFIGIVTRVNANNGEIFVKVQNGFELDELHDVDLKTTLPLNGHLLGYNGTLWVNKTIAGWLGYTPQDAATAITTSNIGSQSVNYANSAGSATVAGYVNNQSGQLFSYDNRVIAPADTTEGYLQFGFTSWRNDGGSPYADYLHMRSYTDSSGGTDNLIMFLKSGIGMRIWQQTWGSNSPYAEYVDVWTTGNFTQTNVNNWNSAYSWGNHSSQGYATQLYVNTAIANLVDAAPDWLNTLNELAAALGDDPNFATTVTNNIAGKVSKSGDTMTGNLNWAQTDRGLTWGMNTDGAYIKFFNTGDGDGDSRLEYATSDNGDEYHRWVIAGTERMNLRTEGLNVNGVIYSSGYGNSTEWYAAYTWGNHAGLYASISHTHTFASITSKPTTIAGYGITNAYTDAQIQNFFNGANAITGYNKSNWDTAYSWGNHASAGYRVNSINNTAYVYATSYRTVNYDFTLDPRLSIDSMSIKLWDNYFNNSGLGSDYGSLLDIHGRGGHVHSQFYMDASNTLYYRSSPYASGWNPWQQIWTSGTLTNLNQLINGPGYITGYTETDTLQSVTSRGSSTNIFSSFNGGLTATKTAKNTYGIQIKGAFYGAPRLQLYDLAVDGNAFLGLGTDMSGGAYEFSNYFPRHAGYGRWSVGSWAGAFGTGQYVSGYNEKLWITENSAGFNVSLSVNGNAVWHAGNDGSGSGLDADTVDGVQADSIVYGNARGTNQSITNNNNDLDKTGYYTADAFTTRPSGVANWMYIEHIKLYNDNTQYQKQIGYDTYDDRMWVRTKSANTWSSWKQIWTSDSLTNLSQLTNGPGYITGYTETDTLQSVTSRGSSTNTDISIGGAGGDRGLVINYGAGVGDYGRIRFYQDGSNRSTIHSFSTSWQNGDVFVSTGAINIVGDTGVTFGSWNVPDVVFRTGGINYFRNNVGFGTTNPTSPVEIINTGSAGGGYSMYSTTYAVGKQWGMRKYGIDNGQGIHWSSDVQFSSTWYNAIRIGHGQNSTNPSFQSYYTTYLATTGGNVAIGTITPQKKFDVVGTAGIIASFGSSISPGQFAGIHFGYSESASNNDSYKKSALVFERTDNNNQGANASGKIHFLLNNRISTSANSLSDAVVTIDSDENGTVGSVRMGIGNRNPARTLDVNGNIGFAGSLFGDNKKVIDVWDSWLRLNQDGAFGSGIYSPGVFRNDGIFYNYGGIEGYATIKSRKAQTAGNYTTAALWTESYDNTATGIAFHISGNYGGFLEMRTDRVLYWADNPVITSGNIGSYAAAINHTHDLGRYSLSAPQNVDGLTSSNFRSTLFGLTSNTWNISTARWNSVPSGLSGMNMYGTMFAWSGSDTHGFIATDYSTANIQVGGGSGNSITWRATLIHSSNIGSYALTSYTETDTLNSVTTRGAATGNAIEVGGLTVTTRDVDVVTYQGRFQVYNGSGTGNLGYRVQTDEQGGWRWQFVDGGNNEYFGVDYPSGNVTVRGAITEQSSLRYKENIINLESITEKVDKLRPVRYNKIGNTTTEIGLIAEEVAEVFPEFVNYNADGEVESLNYTRLSVVLLQTVKELSDKINKLETK